ncbi:MAG: toll/interleukin-1 receptor domain-containing protein [Opitutus sp.]|nr:toll/interleukin-1 receptor domain-containing protein [Opitutus sp.]
MESLAGYWTGSFEGTNIGGVSFGIDQRGAVLGGVATMHEPSLGVYQYIISGQMGAPIKLQLHPTEHTSNLLLGVIDAQCVVQDGTLTGRWQSSLGTNGVFRAKRYEDPASSEKGGRKRNHAFISYSHEDSEFLDALLVHLKPLHKAGLVDVWSDQRIKAGSLWKEEIERALASATVAVLLVSPHFLASDFIVDNELPPLLKRAKEEGVKILPVLLKACRFTRDPLVGAFQAINDPRKPIAALPMWERDELYDRIAQEIEGLVGHK